jgi:hypothetical protein
VNLKSMIKTCCAALTLALVLAAAPASAQAPAQQPATPPGAQPGLALQVQPPSANHLALARELMTQIGVARMFDTFVPNMSRQITGLVTRTRPDLAPDLKVAIETVVPEFEKQKASLVESAVTVFARAMTEQELGETMNFLRTPAGQKFLDTQGQAVNTIAVMLDQWNRQLSVDMFERVRAEMKKKGHDL